MGWDAPLEGSDGATDPVEPGLSAALDAADIGVARLATDGTVLSVGPAFGRVLDRPDEDFVGRHILELAELPRRSPLIGAFARVLAGRARAASLHVRHRDRAGHWHSLALTVAAARQSDPRSGAVLIVNHLPEGERPARRPEPLALVSSPSQDPTRRIKEARRRSAQAGLPFMALSCRVESPLAADDRELVVRRVAERFRRRLRPTDLVTPVEDDRLLAVIDRVDDLDHAITLGERLLASADHPLMIRGRPLLVQLSLHGGLLDATVEPEHIDHLLGHQPGGIHLPGDLIHVADLRVTPPAERRAG